MPRSTPTYSIPPFVRILPPVAAGILLADAAAVPAWAAFVIFAAAAVAALFANRRNPTASSLLTLTALFCFAAGMTDATRTRPVMPHGPELVVTATVTEPPAVSGAWQRATARVGEYRTVTGDTIWRHSGEKVILRADTSLRLNAGDRLIFRGRASDLASEGYESYGRLMQRRGYSATVWIDRGTDPIVLPERARSPRILAGRMNACAAGRLSRLDMPHAELAVAAAMTLGDRSGITPEIREAYNDTGTAHLLAVSGLHVGIVALLVNLLLLPLRMLRYGHVIRNAVAIAAIWLYACVCGLSPSVVRSAAMFTGVQAALASSLAYNRTNTLFATATLMLLVDPDYLFDLSFQLSFAAVAGIFYLFPPLFGAVRTGWKLPDALWASFMVGAAATLATIPLVSCHFGRIAVAGLLLNPLLIITAHATVSASLLWIIAPIPCLEPLFSAVVRWAAGLQNGIVAVGDSVAPSLSIRMNPWTAAAYYIALTTIFIIIRRRTATKNKGK